MGIVICLMAIAIISLNVFFPATYSCKYQQEGKLCICGWDNRPTQELGFNYTEDYCNNIGRVVNGTN